MVYTFKKLASGNVDIFEDGKSISQGGPGYSTDYAKRLGYVQDGAPTDAPVQTPEQRAVATKAAAELGISTSSFIDTSKPSPVASSSSVRDDLSKRGVDPSTATFKSESDFQSFKERVTPRTAAPERTSLVDAYTGLQQSKGVDKMQADIRGIEEEEAALDAELRKFRVSESEGQSANFVGGRISEAERNLLERKDYMLRQKNSLVDELNATNKTIETIMNLTDKDYANARDEYEKEFSQNLQLMQAYQTSEDREADNARANLTTIFNAMEKGTVDAAGFSDAQQAFMNDLEMKAGLPIGFYQSIKAALPEDKIISTTTRETAGGKYADVVTRAPDGSIYVESVFLGGTKNTTTTPSPSSSQEDADVPSFEEWLAGKQDAGEIPMQSFQPAKTAELRKQYEQEVATIAPQRTVDPSKNYSAATIPDPIKADLVADINVESATLQQLYDAYPDVSTSYISSLYNSLRKKKTTESSTGDMTDEEFMKFLKGE